MKYRNKKILWNLFFNKTLSPTGAWYLATVCLAVVLGRWYFMFFLFGYYFIAKLEDYNKKTYP